MSDILFQGSITALMTPFLNGHQGGNQGDNHGDNRDGGLDEAALSSLIEWQIEQGSHGIVPCGTTGESPCLSHNEHCRVVDIALEASAKRVPIITGTGSNSTSEAIALTQYAAKAGADAALVVTPYYNKPSQEGLYHHYMAIANQVELPLIIYNIPSRSVVDMSFEVMARLARHPHIIGVKDATSDLSRLALYKEHCGEDFCQLSGEDISAFDYMKKGGHGCISVSANVAPSLCAQFQTSCLNKDFEQAARINDRLEPLHHALFMTSNPVPVKYAAHLLGLCLDHVRLPLIALTASQKDAMKKVVADLGLKK